MQHLTIAFDLDGTLVETAPDLIRAINHAIAGASLAPLPGVELRGMISFGGRAMIEHALKLHGRALPVLEVDRLHERFLAHYSDNIAAESHAYPGLEEALARLASRGARLVVCTNKLEALSRRLLESLGLARHFKAIAGRDTFPVHKPHPDHLRGAITMAGGDPRHAVMIGDSDTDIQTARAAGLPVIGVPFGYTDTPIYELRPDVVIEHFAELERAIDTLTAN